VSFFDVLAGFRDADLEMADLEERGRRFARLFRAFSREQRDGMLAGEVATITAYAERDPARPYAVAARVDGETWDGLPVIVWSVDEGSTWHESASDARKAREGV